MSGARTHLGERNAAQGSHLCPMAPRPHPADSNLTGVPALSSAGCSSALAPHPPEDTRAPLVYSTLVFSTFHPACPSPPSLTCRQAQLWVWESRLGHQQRAGPRVRTTGNPNELIQEIPTKNAWMACSPMAPEGKAVRPPTPAPSPLHPACPCSTPFPPISKALTICGMLQFLKKSI